MRLGWTGGSLIAAYALLACEVPTARATVTSGAITWWDPAGKVWPAQVPTEATAQWVDIPDNCGAGGVIKVRFFQAGPYPFTPWETYLPGPSDPYPGYPYGQANDPLMNTIFGTNEQSGFTSDPTTPTVPSIRAWTPGLTSEPGRSYAVEFDFSSYNCVSKGAPSAGATYAGTLLGLSDFLNYYPENERPPSPFFTVSATTMGSGPGTMMNEWTIYNSDQGPQIGNIFESIYLVDLIPAADGSQITIRGANQVAPGPAQAKWATDCVLGLVSLPSTERYSTIRFVYDSAAWGYDYMAFTVGSVTPSGPGPSPTPGSGCTPSKPAYASTSPAGKVAPGKAFTYYATLTNSRSAAKVYSNSFGAQAKLSGYPFINATFSITIPTGVTVLPSSWRSSPKLATTPTVDMAAEKLTWQLGSVRTGAKVKISMKLVADACTTPAILPLAGRFAYTDAEGAKAVDACLKKPLYVYQLGCPLIPKANSPAGHKKPISQCTCSACDCDNKGCYCVKSGCTCTTV